VIFKIQGSHRTADEDSSVLGYDSVQAGIQSLELLCTTLKIETVCSSETLASTNQNKMSYSRRLQGYSQSRTNDVTALIRWQCSAFWRHVSLSPDHYSSWKTEKTCTDGKWDKQDSHMVINMQNPPSELSFCGTHCNVQHRKTIPGLHPKFG